MNFPTQDGPGPPRARLVLRPWCVFQRRMGQGRHTLCIFPHRLSQGRRARGGTGLSRMVCVSNTDWARAAARAAALPPRTLYCHTQNGPGPPCARRPWPFALGVFSSTEWARAAARAAASPPRAVHFPTQVWPGPPIARRPWPVGVFQHRIGQGRRACAAALPPRTLHVPTQDGPEPPRARHAPTQDGLGSPRARRPWPFAHGVFSNTERARAAARAAALPPRTV